MIRSIPSPIFILQVHIIHFSWAHRLRTTAMLNSIDGRIWYFIDDVVIKKSYLSDGFTCDLPESYWLDTL